jgi:hypothetical protein
MNLTTTISEIAKRLAAKIPHPATSLLKPQNSFAGLAKGQKLRLRGEETIYTPNTGKLGREVLLQVTDCTNQWVELTVLETLNGSAIVGAKLLWNSRDWAKTFEKAGRKS